MEIAQQKNTAKKVLFIVLNVLFYAFIVLLLLFSIANIKAKKADDIPNVFGRGFLTVQSDSMSGNNKDSFKEHALIFVDLLSDKEKEELKVGDIITYYDTGLNNFNTHRIVEVQDNLFITQGDLMASNPATKYVPGEDNDPATYEIVSKVAVKAKYVSHWNGAGKIYDFIVDHFEWTILLPVALIVILEVFLLVRNIIRYNQEKMKEKYAKASLDELDEETKERLRQELLEELRKEKEEA